MRSRLFFVLIAAFWLTMNCLLWRSQSAAHSQIGSAVPVEVVWDKILTAPDNSSLDIYDHDKKIGFCQWTTMTGNTSQALNQALSDDYTPAETPPPASYGLNLDGNSSIFTTNRVRFEMHLRLTAKKTWQDARVTAKMRGISFDSYATAAQQKVLVKVAGDGGTWQRWLKFSELEHPEALLTELGATDLLGFTGLPGMIVPGNLMGGAMLGLKWEAHEDWMQFGHSRVRVYRVETQFFGQHFFIFTSRAGEILWVEGPNKLTLRNEAFSHF